ncbi:MAG TPA: hypothetical protein VFG89_00420 [Coriobacteriia bacterium]|nr:hypothetical protein [Coriobacteriia bacterium]
MPRASVGPKTVSTTAAKREEAVMLMVEACRSRFPEPEFSTEADERGTVWVKRSDGSRSVGLQPWQLRGRTLVEVLDTAEKKLAH